MDKPVISIVIVSWNCWEFLPACLDSIFRQIVPEKEVILIDNDSSDETAQKVSQQYPQVKLIVNPHNSGYARASNQGIKEAQGEFVVLLNPDTVLQPESLSKMGQFMKENPEVGALGPQLLNPDGSIQPSCRRFPTYSTLVWEFTGLSRLFPSHPLFGSWRMGDFDFQEMREVGQPMASALLIRKKVTEVIGLMDEGFRMFFNDVDYCLRIRQAGFKIVYCPQAKLIHHLGGATRKRRLARIFLSHWGFFQYLKKHHSTGFKLIPLMVSGAGLLVSAIIRAIASPLTSIYRKR
jgi:GT2 family glycosyltransferase